MHDVMRLPAVSSVILGFLLVAACTPSRHETVPRPAAPQPLVEPDLVSQVEILRTEYGVPHIVAENIEALGFGLAYCQVEDHGVKVARGLIESRGELARHVGRDALDSDFFFRRKYRRALDTYHLLSQDARDLMEGFAEGVNWYIRLHPSEFPEWIQPTFTGHDVHARLVLPEDEGAAMAGARRVIQRVRAGELGDAREENPDGDGSNAWAFAPSRTTSGHAILMRNPHLSWDAGYYEVHLIVPGRINFYGDVRVGYPLYYIGGFNERLGWATTNNGPDLDEVYALDADPQRPDHYLFDGGSVPLRREEISVEFRNGDSLAIESREFWSTPLGPVVYRGGGKVYVSRSAIEGEYRLVDQYLRMMQAMNLDEWLDAMRMRAHEASNFTYADADGNIHYLWNATLPRRPHDSGGDTLAVPARRSSEIWTSLVPFDSLPRLRNPAGGYIHNENDPFHFTNLNEPFDSLAYPSGDFPRPELELRSQLSLDLIHETPDRLSLEDVVRLKHTTRMLLADRVKGDLVAAVQASAPIDTVLQAIDLIARWDNTTSVDSRGAMLFEIWFQRYLAQTAGARSNRERWDRAFAVPWTPAEPASTPRGLADPERAVEAFAWAVGEATRLFGSWDVAWGEVHRARHGGLDLPVGGCTGGYGCFRTLGFRRDDDGKYAVYRGDAWVFAVEFGEVPRAYSILAYGESSREDSPHHVDQLQMFTEGRMKTVAFTPEDIEVRLRRRYRPGREEEQLPALP